MTSFSSVIGHKPVTGTLARLLSDNKEPHALLLVGPEGVGKSTVAREYCRALLCENRTACGRCASCRLFESNSHPDLVHLHPGLKLDQDDKGEVIQIKAVRRLVLAREAIGPAVSDRVAVWIQQAERLTWNAANALLKILEEPPMWMRFVITAVATDTLPPTVSSRCTSVALGPVESQELEDGLASLFGVEPEVAKEAALLSSGLPGVAWRFLKDPQARERVKRVVETVQALAIANPSATLAIAEQVRESSAGLGDEEGSSGRTALAEALVLLSQCFRDAALLALAPCNAKLAVPIAESATRQLAARGEPEHWCECARLALEARNAVLGNAGARYQLDALMSNVAIRMTLD